MRFIKMNGAGNDYVFIDARESAPRSPERLAVRLSERHYGIGSDGLVLIEPSAIAHAKMRMFNADGSEGAMCGNAVRCLARYLSEHGEGGDSVEIETRAGVRTVEILSRQGNWSLRVNMGPPAPIERGSFKEREIFYTSVGNPHAVVFLPAEWEGTGAFLRNLSASVPGGVNAESVEVLAHDELRVRVHERGSGETLACGTGASAAAYVAFRLGACAGKIKVKLKGGDLEVEYLAGELYLTGDAAINFQGEYDDGEDQWKFCGT